MRQQIQKDNMAEWQLSMPAEVGVDPRMLDQAYEIAAKYAPLHCLLVVRFGRLIAERYFGKNNQQTAFNIHSTAKSILSALVGIALNEHILTDLDEPIAHWLPEYFKPGTDPSKSEITLKHLLTMSAGLGWIENYTTLRRWRHSPDRVKYVLDLSMVGTAGRRFVYNTGLTHLLSVILTRASGMTTPALARKFLFDPLGVGVARWMTDSQGYYIGGSDMCLTARDMARFGLLYLQHGMWNGRSIVPTQWVNISTRPQISLRQPGFWHPAYTDYGFLWWLRKLAGHDAIVASGYAGQIIFIVPVLDLVVVTTATARIPNANVMKQSNQIEELVESYVIPAVKPGESSQAIRD
jgi:CubicO group peptidase (beta-lactamase class C family)